MLEPNSVANPRHDDTEKSHSHPEYVLSVAATPCEATMHVLAHVCFQQRRDDTRTRVPAEHDEFDPDRICWMFECGGFECGCSRVDTIRYSDTSELLCSSTFGATQFVSEVIDMIEILALRARTLRTTTPPARFEA